ncbi:MAG: hypothetical protein ABEI52_00205, partial [Halobacteriaceae archaeon]
MVNDGSGESIISSLPPEMDSWLQDTAEEQDITREELLARLVASYRDVAGDNKPEPVVTEEELQTIQDK